MDRNIKVTVEDRVATTEGDPSFICGNSTYTVTFTFDDEWEDFEVKTALFKWLTADGMKKHEQPFTGDTVEAPVFFDTREVEVGVYAGDLATTTGAPVRCTPSIRCGSGEEAEPEPDKYDALMEIIKGGGLNGEDGASAYEVAKANGYEGTEQEWLASLAGKSAYQMAVEGGYEGTEAEFTEILAAAGKTAERPTATIELGDNAYVVAADGAYGARVCSWGEEVPLGTEIKAIEIFTEEYGWIDLRDLNTIDPEANFYVVSVRKAYLEPIEYVTCFGGFTSWGTSVFSLMAANGLITDARVTYYTDGGESVE